MIQSKYIKFLKKLNFKSIYYNFKLFPFKIAIKLPILISNTTYIPLIKRGSIIINCSITPGLIQIGYGNIPIFDYKKSRSVIKITGKVIVNGKVRIGQGSKINVVGTLELGNNFMINAESTIIANNKIIIKDNVLFSWNILVMDDDFHKIIDLNSNEHINKSKEVIINKHVWIGARTLILKGSNIPENCVIAADSTVTCHYHDSNVVYGGNPLKIIRKEISWEM